MCNENGYYGGWFKMRIYRLFSCVKDCLLEMHILALYFPKELQMVVDASQDNIIAQFTIENEATVEQHFLKKINFMF